VAIARAEGILMARHSCSVDEAASILRGLAEEQGRTVEQAAVALVNEVDAQMRGRV
jgi:AmiR/NasT family two-component response regulator